MSALDYLITLSGLLLEFVILWRAVRAELWRHYSFFYIYVASLVLATLWLLFLLAFHWPNYALLFWLGSAMISVMRYLVVWEVFRQAFPPRSVLRQVVGIVLVLFLTTLAATLAGGQNAGLVFADLERKSSLAQAAAIALALLLARYYGVSLGRNVWGMAFGLGLYVSLSIMNFSALELTRAFLPYWRYLLPLTSLATLGIWLWALWDHVPQRALTSSTPQAWELNLTYWEKNWTGLRSTLRRIVGL